ncbi:hypothetical protein BGZ52_011162 [Haplosporangium bisporale]|nr:hypothetical protein BGZ52_011162 [Haplosporangium bisporale]
MFNPNNTEGGLVIPLKSPEVDKSTSDRPEQHAEWNQHNNSTYEQYTQEHTYHPLDQSMYDPQATFYNNGPGNEPTAEYVPPIKQEDFEDSLDHLFAQQLEEYHNAHDDDYYASEDGGGIDEGGHQRGFKKRHKRSMSPAQKALIEERISMERPNRTLFVRNIDKFGINEYDIRQLYKPYGDIRNVCNLIDKRGMIFIAFLDVHFSLPKNPSDTNRNCEEGDNQGTLFVHLRQAGKEDIDDDELKEVFERWGEVRSIRRHKQTTHQRFVEFFDSRACVKAHHSGQNLPFHRGSFDVKYAWDSPKYGVPKPGFAKRRSFDKSSHRRSSRSPSPKRKPYNSDRGSHGTKRRRPSVESRSEDRHDARNRNVDSDRVKREYDNKADFRNTRSSRYEFGDKRFANEATGARSPDNRKSNDYRSKDDRNRRSGSVRPERNTFGNRDRRGSSEYRSACQRYAWGRTIDDASTASTSSTTTAFFVVTCVHFVLLDPSSRTKSCQLND